MAKSTPGDKVRRLNLTFGRQIHHRFAAVYEVLLFCCLVVLFVIVVIVVVVAAVCYISLFIFTCFFSV